MFDAVVFSGGGSRCFWQAGFYEALRARNLVHPTQISAVSAGCAMACLAATDRSADGLAYFKDATARNPRNFYPRRVLRGGVFPHERMYRDAIINLLRDEAFAELQRGPEIRVLLARPPRWMGRWRAAALACLAYYAEVKTVRPVHPRLAQRTGLRPEVVSVRACASPAELVDLILHSSCTPPITPLYDRGGTVVLDGGAFDPVPVLALDEPDRALVLLTKRYPRKRLPASPSAVYAQPSRAIPISAWDYTNPTALQATFDLGRRDGDAFARRY